MRVLAFRKLERILEDHATRGRSGHYVVCGHAGSYPRTLPEDLFEHLRKRCKVGECDSALRVFECESESNRGTLRVAFEWDSRVLAASADTRFTIDRCETAFPDLLRPTVIVLEGFHRLSTEEQCRVLGTIRGARESSSTTLQLYVFGEWAPQRFFRHWRSTREDRSPPLDEGNLLYLGGYALEDLQERFNARLDGSVPTVEAALRTLLEHTSGDRRLVQYVESQMRQGESWLPARLEELMFDMPNRADVEDIVDQACDALSATARLQLEAILRNQFLRIDREDLEAEVLCVRGLIRCADVAPFGARNITWEIASPLVAQVLCRCWGRFAATPGRFPHASEVLPLRHAVASRAIPLVWEIESLLRNVVSLKLGARSGVNEPLSLAAKIKVEGANIYHSAKALRAADRRDQDLQLVRDPLASCLDVSQLTTILLDAEFYGSHFRHYFEKKADLDARLKQFNSIRKAVAHGKLISCRALDKLLDLRTWFQGCLANAAAIWLDEQKQLECLSVDAKATAVFSLKEGKQKVKVTVENSGAEGCGPLSFELRTRSGSELGRIDRVFLAAGKPSYVTLDASVQAPIDPLEIEIYLILSDSRVKLESRAREDVS